MIHEFPKLNKRDLQKVHDWAETRENEFMQEYYSYKKCGNSEMAERSHNFAMAFSHMIMMIKYRINA